MKQTAVEWLVQWGKENPIAYQSDYYAAIEQALAMEKEQIIDAYRSGKINQLENSELYYNQTFKSTTK